MGYFLPVSPGSAKVTIGGAIAADVHGKNHHKDGSLGNHVSRILLIDGRGDIQELKPIQNNSGKKNNFFWATIGGMGLTGIILEATISLIKIDTSYIKADTFICKDLDELLELIVEKSKEWVVGDPLDAATKIGPMIEQAHLDKVMGFIDQANQDKNKLVIGGKRTREDTGGYFVQPTIFDDVKPENTIFSEEVFGPVLGITTFKDPEEGIALANQNKYGLAASIFTSSNKTAHVAARKIKAGTVAVNCYGEGDITTPFGGYKLSGFGGRDKSLAAHDQYCELKTIWIDLK